MTTFGNQTVVLVSIAEDLDGPRDAHGNPDTIETTTAIGGSRFRMVGSTETTHPGNRVQETWKWTASAHPSLMAATARDKVRYDGATYSILGTPRVVRNMNGTPHHVSVTCERYRG